MKLRRRSIVWLILLATGFAAPPLVAVYLMLGEQGNLPRWLTPPPSLVSFFKHRGRAAPPPRTERPDAGPSGAGLAVPPAPPPIMG